jgi:PleD family two-component response regulator
MLDIEAEVHRSLVAAGDSGVPPCPQAPTVHGGDSDSSIATPHALRVLIVDDALSTRRCLRAMLEHCEDFDVIGEAGDGIAGISHDEVLQPDLVLLDLLMPMVGGGRALQELP